jgi:phosphonate transport system substrate-binding protein
MATCARLVGFALLMSACQHGASTPPPAPLVFGRLPSLHGTVAEAEVRPLAEYLEHAIGTRVEIVEPTTYKEMTRMLAEHKVDVAYLGGVGFSRAEQYGYEAGVMLQRHGSRFQRGLIFTRPDSGIEKLQDLKGRKVAFVEEGSTTGWNCPIATLYAEGIRPTDMKWAFLGGHDAVVKAVLVDRTYDAGACYEAAIEATLSDRPDLVKSARILAKTSQVPNGVIAVRHDYPRAAEVVAALRAVNTGPDAKSVIGPFQAEAFVEPEASDFEAARSVDLLITELTGE